MMLPNAIGWTLSLCSGVEGTSVELSDTFSDIFEESSNSLSFIDTYVSVADQLPSFTKLKFCPCGWYCKYRIRMLIGMDMKLW